MTENTRRCFPIVFGKTFGLSKGCDGIPAGIPSILGKISDFSIRNHGVRGRDYD